MGKVRLYGFKSEFSKPLLRLRLFVRKRKQGCYVASVPLKYLLRLAKCGFRNWSVEEVENGWWLVLEAL